MWMFTYFVRADRRRVTTNHLTARRRPHRQTSDCCERFGLEPTHSEIVVRPLRGERALSGCSHCYNGSGEAVGMPSATGSRPAHLRRRAGLRYVAGPTPPTRVFGSIVAVLLIQARRPAALRTPKCRCTTVQRSWDRSSASRSLTGGPFRGGPSWRSFAVRSSTGMPGEPFGY